MQTPTLQGAPAPSAPGSWQEAACAGMVAEAPGWQSARREPARRRVTDEQPASRHAPAARPRSLCFRGPVSTTERLAGLQAAAVDGVPVVRDRVAAERCANHAGHAREAV